MSEVLAGLFGKLSRTAAGEMAGSILNGENAFEAAARRTRTSVKPDGGRQEGPLTAVLSKYLPHMIGGLVDTVTLPERVAHGTYEVSPEVPGQWSETDELRRQVAHRRMIEDAFGLAGLLVGSPMMPRGELQTAMANRSASLYNPPAKAARAFTEDYPRAAASGSERLQFDIEGRPLVGERIVGRQVHGGPDVALSPAELPAIAQNAAGASITDVAPRALGQDVGRLVKTTDRRSGQSEYEILLRRGLSERQIPRVSAHEVAHLIDDLVGQIPVKGLDTELRRLYNTLNTGQERTRNLTGPQHLGYRGEDIPREMMAEAVRAYMSDPNYIKSVAPNVAAAIRAAVNPNPRVNKHIQFNVGGVPLPGSDHGE